MTDYLHDQLGQFGQGPGAKERRLDSLRRNYGPLLAARRTQECLEIGPGFGDMLGLAIEEWGMTSINSIDTSPDVVRHCNKHWPESCTLVDSSVEFLSERRNCYDVIVAIHVLEHIPKAHLMPFMGAVNSSLRPGGVFIAEVPNMENPVTGLMSRYADLTHEVGFTESSLRYLLKGGGFVDVDVWSTRSPRNGLRSALQAGARLPLRGALWLAAGSYGVRLRHLNSAALSMSALTRSEALPAGPPDPRH